MKYRNLMAVSVFLFGSVSADAAPIGWRLQMDVFDSIFQPHPSCKSGKMSEMECSNFKARALKRFQIEWTSNAYWKDGAVVKNVEADRRVNVELLK